MVIEAARECLRGEQIISIILMRGSCDAMLFPRREVATKHLNIKEGSFMERDVEMQAARRETWKDIGHLGTHRMLRRTFPSWRIRKN